MSALLRQCRTTRPPVEVRIVTDAIPVAVIGVLAGVWMHHKVPEKLFFGLAYVFLVITGSKLIWEALAT